MFPVTIKTTPTSIAVTGGTDRVFGSILARGANSTRVGNSGIADVNLRDTVTVRVSPPTVNKGLPNGYTQAVVNIKYVRPKILANGKRTTDTVTIIKSFDIETSAADHLALNENGAQLLLNAGIREALDSLSIG